MLRPTAEAGKPLFLRLSWSTMSCGPSDWPSHKSTGTLAGGGGCLGGGTSSCQRPTPNSLSPPRHLEVYSHLGMAAARPALLPPCCADGETEVRAGSSTPKSPSL